MSKADTKAAVVKRLATLDWPEQTTRAWLDQIDAGIQPNGKIVRADGTPLEGGVDALVDLIVQAETTGRGKAANVGLEPPNDPERYLRALRARLIAQRAAAASAQVHNIQDVLDRMESPLDRIDAGQ